jgi:hypothetical protein
MSQENVEKVRRSIDAFDRRDLGAYLAFMGSDCERSSEEGNNATGVFGY